MVVGRTLAIVVTLLSLSACGTHRVVVGGSADSPESKLLAAADAAAQANGGKARLVEAVETTRGKAADLTGHGILNQDEPVWVVEVSGDDYICNACSRPYGADAPSGKYLTLVLRPGSYEDTDFGMSPHRTDISRYGKVAVLRDDR